MAARRARSPHRRHRTRGGRRTGGRRRRRTPRVIAVWGPAGAPGRSTIAIELAVELARGGRHVGLVDADSHAPVDRPRARPRRRGARASRRRAASPSSAGWMRASSPASARRSARTGVDVLTGLNRPSRWPELSESRVAAALAACREWADYTVVDVAAPLERDEEIVSDLDGPRRNAATLAALRTRRPRRRGRRAPTRSASRASCARTPSCGRRSARRRSRSSRTGCAPARSGSTPAARCGARSIDSAASTDVWFVPTDPRAADAALLAARPIADVAPRSPITLARAPVRGRGRRAGRRRRPRHPTGRARRRPPRAPSSQPLS